VLVGLVAHEHDPALLLTVRAPDLRHHGGQIAFPGGVMEVADASPSATALREAHEEIGLDAADVEILGYLPDHVVLTGYRVTPVVARVRRGAALMIDHAEVAQVFELPWSVLQDESRHVPSERRFGGVRVPAVDIEYQGHRIWGLTASILMMLREGERAA
jgi:8-oxo-dGTP pyrophosphatase MutT (NUDIX family)